MPQKTRVLRSLGENPLKSKKAKNNTQQNGKTANSRIRLVGLINTGEGGAGQTKGVVLAGGERVLNRRKYERKAALQTVN